MEIDYSMHGSLGTFWDRDGGTSTYTRARQKQIGGTGSDKTVEGGGPAICLPPPWTHALQSGLDGGDGGKLPAFVGM